MASDKPKSIPRGRLRRLGKVVSMGARVGGDLVGHAMGRLAGDDHTKGASQAAQKVLATLGEMKGVALKVGQMMSMGMAHLPPDVQKVMGKMFAEAPALPYADIVQVVEAELGAPPEKLFKTFAREPFAAASLGQVHKAELLTGEQVAVKVQYPGVAESMREDLANVGFLVKAIGVGRNLFDSQAYYNEMHHELSLELNYTRELALLKEYSGYLHGLSDLVVPRAFDDLCTAKVLTLEFLEGPTVSTYAHTAANRPQEERLRIAKQMQRAVYAPFLIHGVIHADTHPGNFIVLDDGRLGVLDFGSIKRFSRSFWQCYRETLQVGLQGKHPDLLLLMRKAGFTIEIDDNKARSLLDEIAHIVGQPLKGPYDWSKDTMMADLQALKFRRTADLLRVRPPPEALLFYRAVAGLAHNFRIIGVNGELGPALLELLHKPTAFVGNSEARAS